MLDINGIQGLTSTLIPPRSYLYYLEPIGIGTPYVESISGYFERLSKQHNLPLNILFSKAVAPLAIKEPVLKKNCRKSPQTVYGRSITSLNGGGIRAKDFVQALKHLTLRSDLDFLTTQSWSNAFSLKGVFKPKVTWCPVCYTSWRACGKVIYQPLIWLLYPVQFCPIHHQKLLSSCQCCNKEFTILASRACPGYCSHCGTWLGLKESSQEVETFDYNGEKLDWHNWITSNIENLIANSFNATYPLSRNIVSAKLFACIESNFDGNISKFSHYTQMPIDQVSAWRAGHDIPQIITLARICFSLGTTLLDFLTKENVELTLIRAKAYTKNKISQTSIKKYNYNEEMVKDFLQAEMCNYPPRSMSELGKFAPCPERQLYALYPDLCKDISCRYKQYSFNKNKFEVRYSLEKLIEAEIYPPPSRRKAAELVGYGVSTIEKYAPDLCEVISANCRKHRLEQSLLKAQELSQSVQTIAIYLDSQGINPNGTNVSALLPKPKAILAKSALQALKEVRIDTGWDEPQKTLEDV